MAKVTKETQKAVFDPTKQYAWKPDDEFVISGMELQILFNTLITKTQDPEFIQHVNEYECLKIAQNLIQKGVEQGVVVEKPEEVVRTDPAK